jgi:hypothetical protein
MVQVCYSPIVVCHAAIAEHGGQLGGTLHSAALLAAGRAACRMQPPVGHLHSIRVHCGCCARVGRACSSHAIMLLGLATPMSLNLGDWGLNGWLVLIWRTVAKHQRLLNVRSSAGHRKGRGMRAGPRHSHTGSMPGWDWQGVTSSWETLCSMYGHQVAREAAAMLLGAHM